MEFLSPGCTSYKCPAAKSSTSTERFLFPNALIGDQYVSKHFQHSNPESSGIHTSAYELG